MRKGDLTLSAVSALETLYPDAVCSLKYTDAFELLIATRLSAQCTDARVNMVTPALFECFPDAESMGKADIGEVENLIKSCGLYKTKAKDLIEIGKKITAQYGGKVPDTIEELTTLSGVGRKTANLILGDIFGKPAVVVDTHCTRLSKRLGLTENSAPEKIEKDLKALIPESEQLDFCHRLVAHGRAVCSARSPKCEECRLKGFCKEYKRG